MKLTFGYQLVERFSRNVKHGPRGQIFEVIPHLSDAHLFGFARRGSRALAQFAAQWLVRFVGLVI